MRFRLLIGFTILLAAGCNGSSGGGAGGNSFGSPSAVLCSSVATRHEGHFAADPSLASSLSGTTLLHLEPNDEDTIPFHVDLEQALSFDLSGEIAESVTLKDAFGNVLWVSSPEDEAVTVTLAPGDYTLTVTNADEDEGLVVVAPGDCAAAASSFSALKSATSATVYVGDLPGDTHVINGVPTGIAAFVGFTPTGPANIATLVTSYAEFSSQFGDVGDLGNDNLVAFSVRDFFNAGGSTAWIVRIPPDNGRLPGPSSFLGNEASRTGLHALDVVDIFNQLVIPDLIRFTSKEALPLIDGALGYVTDRRSFFIIDPPSDLTTPQLLLQWDQSLTLSYPLRNAALYFPLLQVQTPSGALRNIGAGGAMAGLYASVDTNNGVWMAPAGINNGRINDAFGLTYSLTETDNGDLNAAGLDAIRNFPIYGITAWGARTLEGADALNSDFGYINVRRLALYIEESLQRGLAWVVFEPNDASLWGVISQSVNAFMQNLQNQGAFYDFRVQCDASTTTPFDITIGVVNVVVSISPVHPAEFIVLYFQFPTLALP